MQRVFRLYQSSIGKKFTMALSGIVLYGFVFVHMVGNLKVYMGAEKFNSYARFLREFGYPALGHEQMLWIARIVLVACLAVHVVAVVQLYFQSKRARGTPYKVQENLSFSYASGTMRWGGVVILAFVLFHLLHLTTGNAHPVFDHDSPYNNVVTGFQVWYVSLGYVLCMIPLGLHLYHGLWSMTQTLALQNRHVQKWRRPVAAVVAALIVLANISIPVAVLAGLVRVQ